MGQFVCTYMTIELLASVYPGGLAKEEMFRILHRRDPRRFGNLYYDLGSNVLGLKFTPEYQAFFDEKMEHRDAYEPGYVYKNPEPSIEKMLDWNQTSPGNWGGLVRCWELKDDKYYYNAEAEKYCSASLFEREVQVLLHMRIPEFDDIALYPLKTRHNSQTCYVGIPWKFIPKGDEYEEKLGIPPYCCDMIPWKGCSARCRVDEKVIEALKSGEFSNEDHSIDMSKLPRDYSFIDKMIFMEQLMSAGITVREFLRLHLAINSGAWEIMDWGSR